MRIWREYRCDFGHSWVVQKENRAAPEEPTEVVCTYGHVAVTCRVSSPVDEVQVLIRSAARIDEGGAVVNERRYAFAILAPDGRELTSSKTDHSFEDVIRYARMLRGMTVDEARSWWASRDL